MGCSFQEAPGHLFSRLVQLPEAALPPWLVAPAFSQPGTDARPPPVFKCPHGTPCFAAIHTPCVWVRRHVCLLKFIGVDSSFAIQWPTLKHFFSFLSPHRGLGAELCKPYPCIREGEILMEKPGFLCLFLLKYLPSRFSMQ